MQLAGIDLRSDVSNTPDRLRHMPFPTDWELYPPSNNNIRCLCETGVTFMAALDATQNLGGVVLAHRYF